MAGELVYIEPKSVQALQNIAKQFKSRTDGKQLRKELNEQIKRATQPLEADIKANARGLMFKDSGRSQRERRTAGVTKTGRTRKGKGLRTSLAAGVKTEISYRSGAGAGVRIRLKSSDTEINQLGKALNRRGKIRHPLFGRDIWFDTVSPNAKDWFYSPVGRHRDDVVRGVKAAVDQMLNRLARDIER